LKDAGANININSLTDHTPLHLAITFKKFDAALRLIHCGAKLNLEDEKGLTPLYTAIVVNDYQMAEMLLMHGARLLPSQYLLNYTIRNKMSAMTRLLIRAGENVNGRDYLGWTPILLAINERDTEMIEFLIENGAKMNGNDYILKELHIAVQQSNSLDEFHKMFTILIRNGVHIDNLNKWGETPLCLAMLMEKFKIAEYLIKEGSNVNGGCTIKAKDCLLLVRDCNNVNLTKLFGKYHTIAVRTIHNLDIILILVCFYCSKCWPNTLLATHIK
jgi:ankyrin repeat protein